MSEIAQTPCDSRSPERWRLARLGNIALKLALAGGALVLCWRVAAARFADFDGSAFWAHLSSISAGAFVLALFAAALSYAAISCYDLLAFRALGLTAPAGRILRTGAASTALGQLFGFGLIIGAFVRWRLLRQSGVNQQMAAGASAIVTVGFLSGLIVLGSVAATLWPNNVAAMTSTSEMAVQVAGGLVLIAFVVALAVGRRGASIRVMGRVFVAPRPTILLAQVALAAIDVLFAAAVLWLLMPAAAQTGFGAMFLAYIGVLAICLLANTPGGVGPLEGALLFALPHAPAEALLAGIVAFRIIYYATPGLLGLLVLIDGETGGAFSTMFRRTSRQTDLHTAQVTPDNPAFRRALAQSGRAEDELAHLGDKSLLPSPSGRAFLMFRQRGRALVAIGDPIGDVQETAQLCRQLLALAAERRLTPVFYKTGPALAKAAHAAGLGVDRMGGEAIVDLTTFTIAGRDRREIRRKVRRAAKSGVTIIAHAPGAAPLATFARLCDEWQAARKTPETSFSMGRCDALYLRNFPIFEAQLAGMPVAFISLWRSGDGREWSIDVMRHGSSAPPGTMQSLVVAACDGARAAGATKFNLCIAPFGGLPAPLNLLERAGKMIYLWGERFHRLQGLHRFKASFRPTWHPRYVSRAKGLRGIYGLWAVHRLIHSPPPPVAPLRRAAPPEQTIHNQEATRAADQPDHGQIQTAFAENNDPDGGLLRRQRVARH